MFQTLHAAGNGGEGGEEADAGAERAGETTGGGEGTTPGAETGPTNKRAKKLLSNSSPCRGCSDPLRLHFVQEEDERRAKEEQERREEEEYQKLKASFIIEDQGEEEQLSEDQVSNLPTLFHRFLTFLIVIRW